MEATRRFHLPSVKNGLYQKATDGGEDVEKMDFGGLLVLLGMKTGTLVFSFIKQYCSYL